MITLRSMSAKMKATDLFAADRAAQLDAQRKRRCERQGSNEKRSAVAAAALSQCGSGVDLDLQLLLHELPLDRAMKWIRFTLPCGANILVDRMKLRHLARLSRSRSGHFRGMRAWLSSEALHVRWGTGGLDLHKWTPIDRAERDSVRVVTLKRLRLVVDNTQL